MTQKISRANRRMGNKKKQQSPAKQQNGKGRKKEEDEDAVLAAAASAAAITQSSSIMYTFSFKGAVFVAILAVVIALVFFSQETPVGNPPKKDPSTGRQQPKASSSKSNSTPPSPKETKRMTPAEIQARGKGLPCKDRHSTVVCSRMAANGDCEISLGWMTVMCAASCNTCELLDPKKRCSEENMKIKFVDAYQPGDLNKMFESLLERKDVNIEVLHKNPWMVLVRNFITESESSTLLKLTAKGLKRSTDQGPVAEDGFQEQIVSQYRTSSNSWCMGDCETHPIVANLMSRISELVSIPVVNFESFQVLRYEETQKYDVHHDGTWC